MFRRAEHDAHLITKMIAKMWPSVSSIAGVVAFLRNELEEKTTERERERKERKKESLNKKNRGQNFPIRSVLQFNVSPQFSVYLASIAGNVSARKGGKNVRSNVNEEFKPSG